MGRSSWICWTSLLPSAGGEKTAATLRGTNSGWPGLALGLNLLEDLVILDGVVDRGSGQQCVEAPASGRGIVLFENGLRNRLFRESLPGLGDGGVRWLVVVDVEPEDISGRQSRA